MDQFLEIFLFINTMQRIASRAVSISHHAVMSAHHSCKKTKTNQPGSIWMLEAFIIYQSNFFVYNRSQKLLVVGLQFPGVREKKIFFFGNKHFNRHFLNSK